MTRQISGAFSLLITGIVIAFISYFITLVSYSESTATSVFLLILILTGLGFLARIAEDR